MPRLGQALSQDSSLLLFLLLDLPVNISLYQFETALVEFFEKSEDGAKDVFVSVAAGGGTLHT